MPTVSYAKWHAAGISKEPRILDLVQSPINMKFVTVSFGSSENYRTGGFAIDLKHSGGNTILFAQGIGNVGHVFYFEPITKKLIASNGNGQLSNNNTSIRNETVDLFVIEQRG